MASPTRLSGLRDAKLRTTILINLAGGCFTVSFHGFTLRHLPQLRHCTYCQHFHQ